MLVDAQLASLVSSIYTLLTKDKMTFKDEPNLIKNTLKLLMKEIVTSFISDFKDENINTPIANLIYKRDLKKYEGETIYINMTERKIFIEEKNSFDIPVPCECMHIIFTNENVQILAPDGVF